MPPRRIINLLCLVMFVVAAGLCTISYFWCIYIETRPTQSYRISSGIQHGIIYFMGGPRFQGPRLELAARAADEVTPPDGYFMASAYSMGSTHGFLFYFPFWLIAGVLLIYPAWSLWASFKARRSARGASHGGVGGGGD